MSKLTSEEVTAQLRRAVTGEVAVKLDDPIWDWKGVYAGDCTFLFDDWRITFFNDCDELDYCENATAPDGRAGDTDSWCGENANDSWRNPLDALTVEEQNVLERLLEQAR